MQKEHTGIKILILILFAVSLGVCLRLAVAYYAENYVLDYDKYISVGQYHLSCADKEELWKSIVKSSKIKKYPKIVYLNEKEKLETEYRKIAKEEGVPYEEYLKQKDIDGYAKEIVKNKLIIYSIAEKENIHISEEEYQKRFKRANDEGMDEKSFEEQFGVTASEYIATNELRSAILLEKILKNLLTA